MAFDLSSAKPASQGFDLSTAKVADEPKEQSWGDVALNAVKNTPKSAANFVGGIAHAVAHPIDTMENLSNVIVGGIQNALPDKVNSYMAGINEKLSPGSAELGDIAQQKASQVGQFYKDRYGSVAGVKNAISNDPVGVLSDASTVLTGGGSAVSKLPVIGKVGETAATVGNALNPINLVAKGVSGASNATGLSDAIQNFPEKWMQKAIKPDRKDVLSGDAAIAVKTMLDEGISPNKGGMDKLHQKINDLNDQIATKIASSNASIDKNDVLKTLDNIKQKFTNQVTPMDDLTIINKVADEFANHPYFKNIENKGELLKATLEDIKAAKVNALQDAGKFKTFAAQQKNLAEGGNIKVSPTPENQPYINVGSAGKSVVSPSAYPVEGYPRISDKYTHNAERVPEGEQAASDAIDIYNARKAQEANATQDLTNWESTKDKLPVQTAQEMKQGTYKILSKKYGQLGSADVESQKGLARGLKEGIAEAVPEVAGLNAQESKLITTLNVVEKKALIDANKNPMGLALLAHNPAGWAAFIADRSATFKALAARMVNNINSKASNIKELMNNSSIKPDIMANSLYQLSRANEQNTKDSSVKKLMNSN